MSAREEQKAILQYLRRRLSGGQERFCTIRTLEKGTGLNVGNQYLRALVDDLETSGLITTRQVYSATGGRLFQITAKGIDYVDSGFVETVFDSAAWTGAYDVAPHRKAEVISLLGRLRSEVESAPLPNARKANALSLIGAAELLAEAPDPPWALIVRILKSPELANLVSIASLIVGLIALIRT